MCDMSEWWMSDCIIRQLQAENVQLRKCRLSVENDALAERDCLKAEQARIEQERLDIFSERQAFAAGKFQLAEDLARSQTEVDMLQYRIQEVEEQLATNFKGITQRLQQGVQQCRLERDALRKDVADANERNASLTSQQDAMQKDLSEAKERNASLHQKQDAMQKDLAHAKQRAAYTISLLRKEKEEQSSLVHQHESAQTSDAAVQTDPSLLLSLSCPDCTDRPRLQSQISELRKDNSAFKKQLLRLSTSSKDKEDDLAIAESLAANFKDKLAALQHRNSELKKLNLASQNRIRELECRYEQESSEAESKTEYSDFSDDEVDVSVEEGNDIKAN